MFAAHYGQIFGAKAKDGALRSGWKSIGWFCGCKLSSARCGEARRGKAREGKARQGEARRGKARQGEVR
jgi:hypothetical protein